MSTINVKPWYNPNSGRTRVLPLGETQAHTVKTWGGLEFKALYSDDVVPAIVPLNFVGIKNIRPPTVATRMYVPLPKYDPVAAGVPIMVTPLMPHAFCPIL